MAPISTLPLATTPKPASSSCSSSSLSVKAVASSAGGIDVVSKWTVLPEGASALGELRLSVSDLPMLSCQYIQKGLFFTPPPMATPALVSLLVSTLARALALFPALAGRLATLADGSVVILCNDAGVEFSYAVAPSLLMPGVLPPNADVPPAVKSFFPLDGAVSFQGHFRPLAAFQLTELGDGAVFLGAAVNHAVVDGTSFWNFFNAWAELCRGDHPVSPDFRRNYFGESKAVLRFPGGRGPEVTFPVGAPLRERIFRFSRHAIVALKSRANGGGGGGGDSTAEICGKQLHDKKPVAAEVKKQEISSFQSPCALVWRSVTRSRKRLPPEATTTFRMAVNCRRRVAPPVAPNYFGNAIQSIPTQATVGEVSTRDLRWSAALLHRGVAAHGDETVRRGVSDWEAAPRCFPLGNPDGAGLTMGSSNRFPMYEGNDFGWGLPVAVRSGRANKFDGKMSAFPGRAGGGSVELEVCLAPDTMVALLQDEEFMSYVEVE
ncbi:BAHD acyltransferase DCR-like [Zingiber officinale]|uniref:Acetyltransferase n=1 Tax=Zingiber officinale TaxID=94328 RepID=A0A8J5K9V8_ZINOF|nr:BAHD acyltransferase DCR-like [Zingiber officinale]KAG6480190.1 hypothetical protein ZIOFF_063669 [Zingiber officinale]